jgi:hypothetical protein
MNLPEKVAKSENQNADTGKLDNGSQISVKFYHEIPKHWSHGERTHSHDEVGCGDQRYDAKFPVRIPVLYKPPLEIPSWEDSMCIWSVCIHTNGSWGSLDGCGTNTLEDAPDDLTK